VVNRINERGLESRLWPDHWESIQYLSQDPPEGSPPGNCGGLCENWRRGFSRIVGEAFDICLRIRLKARLQVTAVDFVKTGVEALAGLLPKHSISVSGSA
jgi:hypothetical protein